MATTLYSTQLTNERATPPVLNTQEHAKSPVVKQFSYTVPAATIAAGDTLLLVHVPAGATILRGKWHNDAGGAAATGKIGKYNGKTLAVIDDDWFGTLTDMSAETNQTFADTLAKHTLETQTADIVIGVLTAAQAIQAGCLISGFIEYIPA